MRSRGKFLPYTDAISLACSETLYVLARDGYELGVLASQGKRQPRNHMDCTVIHNSGTSHPPHVVRLDITSTSVISIVWARVSSTLASLPLRHTACPNQTASCRL